MEEILANYQGVRPEPKPVVQLITPDKDDLVQYTAPVYPVLAKFALIEGTVECEITIEPGKGNVKDVHFISGHQLLQDSARKAIFLWQFDTNHPAAQTIRATLIYTLGCK
jgi:outer membrane biosynthesis protein TonB